MNPCQNCGKLNSGETNFCRFCGTKFVFQSPVMDDPFDHRAPRPYAWKTDEFQTHNEARKTMSGLGTPGQAAPSYQPAPLTYQQHPLAQPFRCPNCMSQYLPRMERRISTAGWITFAVLLVFFFPLFWIGLLIKEDVQVCQVCNSKMPAPAHR